MNPDDIENTATAIIATIRTTLRTEVTSVWLPIQLGDIAVTALVAIALAALVRRRFDLSAATMGWPAYLRLAGRALHDNFAVLIFILLIMVTRASLEASLSHARTYLLLVATNLATAWVVIAIVTSLIRNHFINRIVAVTAWTIAALSILGLLDATSAALDARGLMIV